MLQKVSKLIRLIIEGEGKLTSFLVLPLVFVMLYEVVVRYGFNAPTTWGFEVALFFYGLHYMFGMAFTEHEDGHVKVDVLVSQLSERAQLVVKIITTGVLSLPVLLGLTIWTSIFAYASTVGMERSWSSWSPSIWPFKICMALGFFFLFLQGVGNLLGYIHELSESGNEG